MIIQTSWRSRLVGNDLGMVLDEPAKLNGISDAGIIQQGRVLHGVG